MSAQIVYLVNPSNHPVAVATVTEETDRFGGIVDLSQAPAAVRALFDEFEEVVNGQMFSFLDEVEAKVADLKLTARFPDGSTAPVSDLQIYPTTGEVSFKVAVPVG